MCQVLKTNLGLNKPRIPLRNPGRFEENSAIIDKQRLAQTPNYPGNSDISFLLWVELIIISLRK